MNAPRGLQGQCGYARVCPNANWAWSSVYSSTSCSYSISCREGGQTQHASCCYQRRQPVTWLGWPAEAVGADDGAGLGGADRLGGRPGWSRGRRGRLVGRGRRGGRAMAREERGWLRSLWRPLPSTISFRRPGAERFLLLSHLGLFRRFRRRGHGPQVTEGPGKLARWCPGMFEAYPVGSWDPARAIQH